MAEVNGSEGKKDKNVDFRAVAVATTAANKALDFSYSSHWHNTGTYGLIVCLSIQIPSQMPND